MKSERSKARDKADKYFSDYVRQRDADENGMVRCCTCNKPMHWKASHNGHFQSRRYDSTRFDEHNCGVQCPGCNTFNQGEQFKFALYLDKRYGSGTAEKITIKSRMLSRRNRYDYQCIAEEYKNKLKKLK